MFEKTRTEYSFKNATVAFASRIVSLLFAYGARVVFVHVLNSTYTGAYGLLTNIIGTFTLSSLGIDAALVFMLYAPIADEDERRQRILIKAYNKIHLAVGAVVASIALVMYLVMPVISEETTLLPDYNLIYWLFAGNIIMGYVFSYKPMIFIAKQRNYVNDLFESGMLIMQYIVQSVVLIITRSYLLFTLVYFLAIVIKNIAATKFAEREYPYIKKLSKDPLPKEDKKLIGKNLWAILVQKFGVKLINYTDTILLSNVFGIGSIARFSSCSLILVSVTQLLEKTLSSVTGSIGNLGVTTDKKRVEKVFNASLLLTCFLSGIIALCLYESLGLFVELSFGKEYVYSNAITAVLCINFYFNGIRSVTNVYRNSLGLFWRDRYRAIIEAVANVIFSIVAIKLFGEIGIFLGTTASVLSVPMWMEPRVIYKNYFNKSLIKYFLRLGGNSAVVVFSWLVSDFVCRQIGGGLLLKMICRLGVSVAIPSVIIIFVFHKTEEYKLLKSSLISIVKKRRSKRV